MTSQEDAKQRATDQEAMRKRSALATVLGPCATCGGDNRTIARFCKYCGQPIAAHSLGKAVTLDVRLGLNGIIGRDRIKKEIATLVNLIKIRTERRAGGHPVVPLNLNTIFLGNTGTGKTLIAKVLASTYKELGILSRGHIVEADAKACAQGPRGLIKTANGGVLLIDEAHRLVRENAAFFADLQNEIERGLNDEVIIIAGLAKPVEEWLADNPEFAARFNRTWLFEDYTGEELAAIARLVFSKFQLTLDDEAKDKLLQITRSKYETRASDFKNAWYVVRDLFEETQGRQANRLAASGDLSSATLATITADDLPGDMTARKSVADSMKEMSALVGMDTMKAEIESLIKFLQMQRRLKEEGRAQTDVAIHCILTGNPGTGKTTVARILANVFHSMGLLPTNKMVEVDRAGLVGDYVGSTALKTLQKIDEAMGGVLFIDEAYTLVPEGGDTFGQEAIEVLLKRMEDRRGRFVTVAAGYKKEMERFIKANPGLPSRFNRYFHLEDYTAEELAEIYTRIAQAQGYTTEDGFRQALTDGLEQITAVKDREFANARTARNLFERTIQRQSERVIKNDTADSLLLMIEDLPTEQRIRRSLDEILGQLDGFVGMNELKVEIRKLAKHLSIEKVRSAQGLKTTRSGNHMVFTGNPGTGKTTVARILGEVFSALGLLPHGRVVEVDRSQMVAQYVGGTAPRVMELCDKAIGGILFVDEAYTLAPPPEGGGDGFGKEALEALMKRMEDDRERLVVIAAGYKDDMDRFLGTNPGLKSRFNRFFHFEDYEPDELQAIFLQMATGMEYTVDAEAGVRVGKIFADLYRRRTKDFANGRDVRNLLENTLRRQSDRMSGAAGELTRDILMTVTAEDIAYELPSETTAEDALAELDELVGLDDLKAEVRKLVNLIRVQRARQEAGAEATDVGMHMVFTGNPGTGKTTVARIIGRVFCGIGLLPVSHVVETDRSGLVGQYVGSTPKLTTAKIDQAMGGILFVDEAYTLKQEGGSDSSGLEAIDTIVKRMEDDRGKFVVIAAGYKKDMDRFLAANPGIKSRFNRYLHFPDYQPAELQRIFESLVKKRDYRLTDEATAILPGVFQTMYDRRDANFGNGRDVRNLFEDVLSKQAERLAAKMDAGGDIDPGEYSEFQEEDLPVELGDASATTIGESFAKLNSLIGLGPVKREVESIVAYLETEIARQKQGGQVSALALHYLFLGNPGTGKTTVARIIADVFKAVGILPRGQLVETDRSGLVSGYVGQTAGKTNAVIDSALGGVLFIDEAYALASGGPSDFGQEAIDTLLKRMEDERGKLIVIAAGYEREMQNFLKSNSGLRSRFSKTIVFPDYEPAELRSIFVALLKNKQMQITKPALKMVAEHCMRIYAERGADFANGRTIRNYFEAVLQKQAVRVQSRIRSGGFNQERINIIEESDIL